MAASDSSGSIGTQLLGRLWVAQPRDNGLRPINLVGEREGHGGGEESLVSPAPKSESQDRYQGLPVSRTFQSGSEDVGQ